MRSSGLRVRMRVRTYVLVFSRVLLPADFERDGARCLSHSKHNEHGGIFITIVGFLPLLFRRLAFYSFGEEEILDERL